MNRKFVKIFSSVFLVLFVFYFGILLSFEAGGQFFCSAKDAYADSISDRIIAASTGSNFSLLATSDGTVKAWGYNNYGQLGLGNTTNYYTPQTIPSLTNVKQLIAGYGFAFALLNDGTVKAWGYNNYGQLGLGNTTNYYTPQTISGLTNVKQLAAGTCYAMALLNDGTVKAWGYNSDGQLGLGNTTTYTTPQIIPGLTNVKQLVAGYTHSLALLNDGTVRAWGYNYYGQLGLGNTATYATPQIVPSLTNVKQLTAGYGHTLALLNDGTVKAWGNNGNGQLGLGNTANYSTPQTVTGISNAKSLAAGNSFSIALMNDNTLKSWGQNSVGCLGLGNTTDYNTPQSISGLNGVSIIISQSFAYHNIAIMNDGSIKVWGGNGAGQLGLGDTSNRVLATPINGIYYYSPIFSITSPLTDSITSISNMVLTPSIIFSSNNIQTTTCKYFIDSETIPRDTRTISNVSTGLTQTFSTLDTGTLSDGKHTLKITADDGIVLITKSVDFLVDRTAPIIKSIDASVGVNNITVSGLASDNVTGFNGNAFSFKMGDLTSSLVALATAQVKSSVASQTCDSYNYNGRRLVRLSNGWLVGMYIDSGIICLYKSSDNGNSWSQMCTVAGSNTSAAIAAFGTRCSILFTQSGYVYSLTFDATTVANTDLSSYKVTIFNLSATCKNPSIEYSSNGILHAAWSDKYYQTNQYNIRYCQSNDFGLTWSQTIDVTSLTYNSYVYPNIVIYNNTPVIIAQYASTNTSYNNKIVALKWNGVGFTENTVYSSNSYTFIQSNPTVAVDSTGAIHVAWQGQDSTDTTKYNIRYSKSTDGGTTWSTATKLTSGNVYDQCNPTITCDKDNKVHIFWTATDATYNPYTNIKKITYASSSWGAVTTVTSNTLNNAFNVSNCSNYTDFTEPLVIYSDAQANSINFQGTFPASLSYTFTYQSALPPNKSYVVEFSAKDSAGNIGTMTKEIYTPAVIPALSSINTAITDTTVCLGITDTNSVNTSYQIICGTKYLDASGNLVASPTWFIPAAKSNILIKALTPGTQYTFTVKARNGDNVETDSSNSVTCTTLSEPLAIPLNIKLIPEANKIKLTWDSVQNATGYDVEVDEVVQNNSSTVYEGTFTPGTEHSFRIRAKNLVGTGSWSELLNGSAQYPLPVAPAFNTPTATGRTIILSWNDVSGAAGYELEMDGTIKDINTATTFTVTGLIPSTQHTYRIRAYNQTGYGDWSAILTVMTGSGIPGKPATPTWTATNTTAALTWADVADAEAYEVVEVVGGVEKQIIDNGPGTTCEKEGLSPQSTHIYKVRAKNSYGTGVWSDPVTITMYLLASPADFTITEGDTSLSLSWIAVSGATSYSVKYNGTIVTSITGTTYTISGLTPETQYLVSIKADNASGASAWSSDTPVFTLPTKPAVPANVNATVTDTIITISWDATADISGYDVELDGVILENDNTAYYIHNELEPYTVHTYRVRARNAAVEGDWSVLQSIRTLPGKPVAPDSVIVKSSQTGATISWAAEAGALGYDIEVFDGTNTTVYTNIKKTSYTHRRVAAYTECRYRIRTRNIEGVSAWSGYIINNAIKKNSKKNDSATLNLGVTDAMNFDSYTMVVTFNPGVLEVTDLCTKTGQAELEPGKIEGTNITILEVSNGRIVFSVDKVVEEGEAWTGVINSIKFKAKVTGGTTVTYTVLGRVEE